MKMLLQDFHLLVVVLLSAIVLSDCHTLHRRQVTVSRCAICDDDTPGQECGTSTTHNSINCLGDTPYCATRVTGEHGNHLKIWKGCASEATCISDWWFGTSTNHACSQAIVTSGHVTSGTVCTFCCHDPLSSLYCNDNLYPNNTATFPNVVSTSVSVTSVAPPSVSRCALCDDDTPGQECSRSAAAHGHDSTNCHGNTPYCVTRVTEVGGHLKTWKGCASANTCINDWWMATSTNPACSQASITSGHVTSGTSCTFCCHEPQHGVSSLYCNDNLYPNNIATFPDIPVTTTSPEPDTTIHTTTMAITHTTTPSPTLELSTVAIVTTANHLLHTQCPTCVTDSTTGQSCDVTRGVDLCGLAGPYCMTSLYRQAGGYRVEKRCASESECRILWLANTQTRTACMAQDLQASTGSSLECHYCCLNTAAGNLCNFDDASLIPQHLMQDTFTGGHGHNQQTGPSQTLDLTAPPTHMLTFLHVNTSAPAQLSVSTETIPVAVTTQHPASSGTPSAAASAVTTAAITTSTLDTTTKVPAPAATTESSPTTVPTIASTAAGAPGGTCQVCMEDSNSHQYCMGNEVMTCKGYEPYCLNIVTVSVIGQKRDVTLQKTCATEAVCRSDWWEKTRLSSACMSSRPEPPAGQTELICEYCCQTDANATMPCNNLGIFPPQDRLVMEHSTQAPTPAAASNISVQTVDATVAAVQVSVHVPSSPASNTSTAAMASASNTSAGPVMPASADSTVQVSNVTQCAVCGPLCPIGQHAEACHDGFCMTSVTDDDNFNRIIEKSCVTEDQCYKRWWESTLPQSLCTSIVSMGNRPTGTNIQCHYCCFGDLCNIPSFPDKSTLYDGNKRGTYNVP